MKLETYNYIILSEEEIEILKKQKSFWKKFGLMPKKNLLIAQM